MGAVFMMFTPRKGQRTLPLPSRRRPCVEAGAATCAFVQGLVFGCVHSRYSCSYPKMILWAAPNMAAAT
jgi:hypothetical protein